MVKNLLGYPVILLVTLYLGILNRLSYVLLLFFAEFFLFFLQILSVFYQKRSLAAAVEMPMAVVLEEEPARIRIVLKNAGHLPIQRAEIRTEYRCLTGKLAMGGKRKKKLRLWGSVDRWDTQSYEVLVGPFPGGQFRLSVLDIRIYDYFGIFSLKLRVKKSKKITVLSSFLPLSVNVSGRGEMEDVLHQNGQEGTEFYDIREYQAGDNPRHIYWKRSAGREPLLYREATCQESAGAVVFLQLPKTEGLRLYYLLKLAGSLMYGLLEAGCVHFFVWEREGMLERRWIRSQQELYEAAMELLEMGIWLETGKKKRKKAEKRTGQRKGKFQERMEWQEEIRFWYMQQFPGEELPESFFVLCQKTCEASKRERTVPALILMQEDSIRKEFLKGRKLTGKKEELALLEKEMREC